MPDLGAAPVRISRGQWAGIGVLFGAAILFTVANWQYQLRSERKLLKASLDQLSGWSREDLVKNWRDRDDLPAVKWVPSDKSAPALAIVPRNSRMKRDSVYLLYRGDRPAAALAVTDIGAWWNGWRVGGTLTLSPNERVTLTEMNKLMEEYRRTRNPGSEEIQWTDEAMRVAKKMQ